MGVVWVSVGRHVHLHARAEEHMRTRVCCTASDNVSTLHRPAHPSSSVDRFHCACKLTHNYRLELTWLSAHAGCKASRLCYSERRGDVCWAGTFAISPVHRAGSAQRALQKASAGGVGSVRSVCVQNGAGYTYPCWVNLSQPDGCIEGV